MTGTIETSLQSPLSLPHPMGHRGEESPMEAEISLRRDDDDASSSLNLHKNECTMMKTTTTTKCISRKYIWAVMCGFTIIVVVGIILGIVLIQASSTATWNPTTISTTFTPTMAPTTSSSIVTTTSCFRDSRSLTDALLERKQQQQDYYNIPFMEVELCPGFKERVILNYHDNPSVGATPGLLTQSNLRIKCGPNGALQDRCVLWGRGVDYLVLNSFHSFHEVAARNVTVEGITFQGSQNSFVRMQNAGDVTFRNCLFRQSPDYIPIVIDYNRNSTDSSSNSSSSSSSIDNNGTIASVRQTVAFEGCVFEDLDFGPVSRFPNITTIVLATNDDNTVIFRNCVFRNNYSTTKKEVRLCRVKYAHRARFTCCELFCSLPRLCPHAFDSQRNPPSSSREV